MHQVMSRLGLLNAIVIVAMWGTLCSSSQAVVVSTTTGNTSRPPVEDDPGWSNVGLLKNSTALYLGDGWVLTAAHVGAGPVTFPELGTYEADDTSSFRPANPTGMGLTVLADLVMFRLKEKPPLSPVALAASSPPLGAQVWVAGNGKDRAATQTQWNVTDSGSVWNWSETTQRGAYQGYKTNATNALRWGTNLIESDELVRREFDEDIRFKLATGVGDTLSLVTEFDLEGSKADSQVKGPDGKTATAYESQAVLNDSGGAMFYKRPDGRWELAGTVIAVEGHRNQPDVTRTAIFGDFTFYADIASYLPQIQSRYRFGDFDGDHQLTTRDVELLVSAMDKRVVDRTYDLDRDGKVTESDHRTWIEQAVRSYAGDSNLDGRFDTTDLVAVLQSGQYEDGIVRNSTWATGDWNGDHEFSTSDLVAALQSGGFEQGPRAGFGSTTSALSGQIAAAVPEPSQLVALLFVGGLAALLRRGRA